MYETQHGGLAVYRGDGYCFHSTLIPVGVAIAAEDCERIFVEAKPKSVKEPKLRDAAYTLELLPEPPSSTFQRLKAPRLPRLQRFPQRKLDEDEFFDEDLDQSSDFLSDAG